jgi:hypothetical protein
VTATLVVRSLGEVRMVVFVAPGIHRGLGGLDRGERPGLVEEVGLEISFSSVPSAKNTEPVTSSCRSCIGSSRCQRL